jgi:DNA-binding transcriptional LysR family regulator
VTAISDLDIFSRVARTGNMSAAGREMGLSPAVVSKRISLLEERLGARLFQRTTRQLTLTETGEGYFQRVVDILSLCEEAEDFVARRNTKPRGVLKVTAPTSFSRLHIAPKLNDFLSRFPEVKLDLHLTDHFEDIIRDGFDLAIRIGELQDSSLVARKLAADTRVICAAPKYLATIGGSPRTLDELEGLNCLSAGAQEHWHLEGPDGAKQIKVHGNIRTNSAEFVREALIAGLGIGMRPTWDVGAQLLSGELEVVLPQYRASSNLGIYAVYPCRDYMPEKVSVFIDFLASLFSGDQWSSAAREHAGPARREAGKIDQAEAAGKLNGKVAPIARRPAARTPAEAGR